MYCTDTLDGRFTLPDTSTQKDAESRLKGNLTTFVCRDWRRIYWRKASQPLARAESGT